MTIPTQKNAAKDLEAFEDEFFSELRNQYQRVDLFVQSKTGEVTRRLIHLEKQINLLKLHEPSREPIRLSLKRLEKLSKLEQATLTVGEDIQSLARFVRVQKTAFQKLLKKYRRWTGSSNLATRFEAEVFKRPGSLSTKDFGFLQSQWNGVLAAIRTLFNEENLDLDNKPSIYPDSAGPTSTPATSTGDRPTSSGFSFTMAKSSATSVEEQLESPPPKKSKKRRHPRRKRPLRRQTGRPIQQQPQQDRYWNEFDNGDEALESEPYTIYVNPPKPSHIPGIETLSKTWSSLASGAKIVGDKVRPWMASSSVTDGERQRLIDEVSTEDDSDRESFSPTDPPVSRRHRHYSTFRDSVQGSHWKASERVLFRSCVASLTASFILVVIACVVASNIHRQTAVIVDLGIIIGVVWSLVFALIGAICMIKLANRLGWAHRMAVMTVVSLISVISGLVLMGIVDG